MRVLTTLVTTAALAVMAASSHAADAKRTLKLHQNSPALVNLDLGSKGHSEGDMLAFEASVSGENGIKGTLYGLWITVDVIDGDDKFEDRLGQIYADFGNGNSIVVAGRAVYVVDSQEITAGAPQVRAIIGGTGKYMGARGQVTTTRNADGSYDHLIELSE